MKTYRDLINEKPKEIDSSFTEPRDSKGNIVKPSDPDDLGFLKLNIWDKFEIKKEKYYGHDVVFVTMRKKNGKGFESFIIPPAAAKQLKKSL